MTRASLLLSVTFLCNPGYALQDSTKAKQAPVVKYFSKEEFTGGTFRIGPDTLLDGFQRYYDRNNLGSIGLPVIAPDTLPDPGFNYYRMPFSVRGFNKGDGIYYNTRSPYTDVWVAAGAKKEADFRLLHTQNVNPRLNFAAGFQRIRSEGFYQQQKTNDNNFFLSSNYRSKKNSYNLLAHLVYNSFNYSVNGGIANDTTFEEAGATDKRLIPVNLAGAQRRERNKSATITQYFNLNFEHIPPGADSGYVRIPRSCFYHTFSIGDASWVYEDNDPQSGFYSNVLKDTLVTLDSAYTWKIENSLTYHSAIGKEGSALQLFLRHELGGLKQDIYDTVFSGLMAGANLNGFSKAAGIHMNLRGSYGISGSTAGAMVGMLFEKSAGKNSVISVTGKGKMSAPWFMAQRYSGNHFAWEYDFGNSSQMEIGLGFRNIKWKLGLSGSMYNLINLIYFDSYGRPKQYTSDIQTLSAKLWKDFAWKKLRFNNQLLYQYAPDSVPVHLPMLTSSHSLYYENTLFKGALILQAGADVFYSTESYAPGYMPATGVFFLQNEKKTGNYPFVDVFLNMKIKTVFIFLKMEHANSGLMGNTYYNLLHYPAPDRAFKFGLRWRFLD